MRSLSLSLRPCLWLCLYLWLCVISNTLSPAKGQDIIPGYLEALVGYDLRNASSKSYLERATSQLFEDTYDFGQFFQRPNDSRRYMVPDQLTAYALSVRKSDAVMDISNELTTFEESQTSAFSIGFGFEVDNFGIEAALTRTQGYIHYLFENKSHYGASGQERREVTRLAVGPFVLFTYTPYLTQILQKIPTCPRTPDDINIVTSFIEAYGHVFPSAINLGGTYDIVTNIDSDIVNKSDPSWISTQLSLTFYYLDFDLNSGGFGNKSDINIDDTFKASSESHVFFDGGEYQSSDTLQQWFDSLIDFSTIVSGTFRPTSALVTDDANKRKVLEDMIAEHANTGTISIPTCASMFTSLQVPPIQGYEHLTGFDSLSLDTKYSVFLFKFLQQTWSNPIYPNYTFAVPENTMVWNDPDHVDINITYFATDKEQYQYELNHRVDFSDSFFFLFGGSESSDLYVYSYYYHSNTEVMNEVIRFITWYDVEMVPDVRLHLNDYLNPYAQASLDRLPRDLQTEADEQKYLDYLEVFGDQIVTRVSMGLRIHQKTYIREEVLNQMTITKFHEESQSSFLGLFGTTEQFNIMKQEMSSFMTNEVRFEIKIEGGNQDLQQKSFGTKLANGFTSFTLNDLSAPVLDWNTYVLSGKDYPQPMKYHVTPIYEFIMDPEIHDNMKLMVQKRIQQRTATKKLGFPESIYT